MIFFSLPRLLSPRFTFATVEARVEIAFFKQLIYDVISRLGLRACTPN